MQGGLSGGDTYFVSSKLRFHIREQPEQGQQTPCLEPLTEANTEAPGTFLNPRCTEFPH